MTLKDKVAVVTGGSSGIGAATVRIPLVEATGDVFGRSRAQLRTEFKHAIGETVDAFGAEIAALEQRLTSNAALVSWIDGRIKAALAHEHDGLRRAIDEMQRSFEAKLAALEQSLRAVPGKLPVAKLWQPDSVTYEAQVVCHDGSLWQACKDTAQVPGGSDWVCVARAGRDAVTPKTCGTFNAHKTYARLDIVEYDGNGYLARRDAPGVPGISDGWQLVSRSGRRGATGEVGPRGRKGERGARGEDGREITDWHLERATFRAFPVYADGRMGPELNLRGLFEQYCEETSHAAE